MDFHILSLDVAEKFVPDKPTYALRIFSSRRTYEPLPANPLYLRISEYIFDDNVGPFQAGPISITDDIAREMVIDFAKYRDQVSALLVQCDRGINRSPAVAVALNDVFGLGYDSRALIEKFPQGNPEVHKAIKKAGERYISHP